MSMQVRDLLLLRPAFLWSRGLLVVVYRSPIPVIAKNSTAPHIHVGMPMLLFLWFVGAAAFVPLVIVVAAAAWVARVCVPRRITVPVMIHHNCVHIVFVPNDFCFVRCLRSRVVALAFSFAVALVLDWSSLVDVVVFVSSISFSIFLLQWYGGCDGCRCDFGFCRSRSLRYFHFLLLLRFDSSRLNEKDSRYCVVGVCVRSLNIFCIFCLAFFLARNTM